MTKITKTPSLTSKFLQALNDKWSSSKGNLGTAVSPCPSGPCHVFIQVLDYTRKSVSLLPLYYTSKTLQFTEQFRSSTFLLTKFHIIVVQVHI